MSIRCGSGGVAFPTVTSRPETPPTDDVVDDGDETLPPSLSLWNLAEISENWASRGRRISFEIERRPLEEKETRRRLSGVTVSFTSSRVVFSGNATLYREQIIRGVGRGRLVRG